MIYRFDFDRKFMLLVLCLGSSIYLSFNHNSFLINNFLGIACMHMFLL